MTISKISKIWNYWMPNESPDLKTVASDLRAVADPKWKVTVGAADTHKWGGCHVRMRAEISRDVDASFLFCIKALSELSSTTRMGKDVGTDMLKALKPLGHSTPHKERNAETQRQQLKEVFGKIDLDAARPVSPEFERAFQTVKEGVKTFTRKLLPSNHLARLLGPVGPPHVNPQPSAGQPSTGRPSTLERPTLDQPTLNSRPANPRPANHRH